MEIVSFRPIGQIGSEHFFPEKTPIQPAFAEECLGSVKIFPEFLEGLRDIEGFSHLYLIYHLHKVETAKLIVEPFLQPVEHGIFATRSPWRPNAIGMSLVELIGRERDILHIKGVDILDGTPLLDIKPYSPRFDRVGTCRNGWLDDVHDDVAKIYGRRGYQSSL